MKYLAVVLILAGCTTAPVPADPAAAFSQAIGAAYVAVAAVADGVHAACEAPGPGEPCAPDALITSEQRDEARDALGEALARIDDAADLYNAGMSGPAEDKLAAARQAIAVAKEMVR